MPRPSRRHLPLLLAALLLPGLLSAAPEPTEVTGRATGHVVVLDDGVVDVAGTVDRLLAPLEVAPTFVYTSALAGFAATLTDAQARVLAADPRVELVEADRMFTVATTTTLAHRAAGVAPTGVRRIEAGVGFGWQVTTDADVAVLDTGVDHRHPDLTVHRRADCTRASTSRSSTGLLGSGLVSISSSGQRAPRCVVGRGDDDHGHGTHVAGTIAAADDGRGVVGVAPGARIWSIKVLDMTSGGGTTAEVIAGIDHATAYADELEIVNLSFVADGRSRGTERAIRGATDAGLVVVVAAGNGGHDAGTRTPANAPRTIVVSAITDLDGLPGALSGGSCEGRTDRDDQFATYSNHGEVVDLAAPGSCITSTARGGGTTTWSGTSMAAPHVAGAAARYLASSRIEPSPTRWSRTLSVLRGKAVPQDHPCGFRSGRSSEPLLHLTGC